MNSFKLSMDSSGGVDFIADTGNLENIFSEFMDEPEPKNKFGDNEPNQKSTNAKPVTLLAKVVVAFKLVNAENLAQGNIGLALIENTDLQVILYRTKQEILSTFTLTSPNSVVYAKSDYIQFRDDTTQFWSIHFPQDVDRDEFLAKVAGKCPIEHESSAIPASQTSLGSTSTIEQITLPSSSIKPSIVSRISKMGGHQLPPLTRSTKESDSDDAEPSLTKPIRQQIVPSSNWKPDVPSRLRQYHNYASERASPHVESNTLISYNPVDHEIVSLFTENRFQNTEVRMCLSKLETKIERVLDKIDTLKINRHQTDMVEKQTSDLEEDIINLEEKMLELKKENRLLRMARNENETKRQYNDPVQSKNDYKNIPVGETMEQLIPPQSNEEICSSMTKQIEELTCLQNEHVRLIETLSKEIERLKDESNEKESRLNETVEQLQQKLAETQGHHPVVSPSDDMTTVVKEIMNNMYHLLHESVNQRSNWFPDEVLKLMRTIIKQETINALGQSK